MGLCPLTKCSRAACSVDHSNQNAKLNQEDKDTCRVANGGNECLGECRINGGNGVKIGVKQSTGNNTDEERAIHLFCNQCKSDCNNGRNECPEVSANLCSAAAGLAGFFTNQTGGVAVNASYLVHSTAGNAGND